jgi:AFG3 family protein
MEDFERATERVMSGMPKANNLMSSKDRHAVALHESGHAVVGWFLEHADPLLKVSIVPRSSGALGFAQYLPQEMSLHSKEAILDKIAVALGGRAAEELFAGRISTGASDDLDRVTKMAYSMISVYGMNSELGLISFNRGSGEQQFYKPYSEQTGLMIDRQARRLVDNEYDRVKKMLQEKAKIVHELADQLTTKETLVYHELKEILGDRPFGVPEMYNKFLMSSSGSLFTEDLAEDPERSVPASE